MSPKYDAVIFDLHGTLVPWCKDGFRAMLLEMADTVGAPGDEFVRAINETAHESMTGRFGSVVAHIGHLCRVLGIRAHIYSMERASLLWSAFHRQGYEVPYMDAFAVLDRLHEMEARIGLITNCGAEAPELWSKSKFAPLPRWRSFQSLNTSSSLTPGSIPWPSNGLR